MKENQNIEGHLAVSGNVTVGGSETVRGNAKFAHNVSVEGWLEAPNIKGAAKGVFLSEEDMALAYPSPKSGWWAVVVSGSTGVMYVGKEGAWEKTETTFEKVEIDGIGLEPFITELREEVQAEAGARVEADAGLQAAIDSEVTARAVGDSAEKTARESADNALQIKIESEAAARADADSAEASARDAADSALSERIEAVTPISAVFSNVEGGIVFTVLSASGAKIIDSKLYVSQTVQSSEKPVSAAAVYNVMDVMYKTMEEKDAVLQGNIEAEVSARAAADAAEKDARKADVQGLDDKIIEERDEREGHDKTLQGNIDAEASSRQGEDDVLRGMIVAETASRKADVQGLDDKIIFERNERQAAVSDEASLRAAGDAEVLRKSEVTSVSFVNEQDENAAMILEQGDAVNEYMLPMADTTHNGLMSAGHVTQLRGAVDFMSLNQMPEWNELYPEQTKVRVVDINGENRQTNLLKLLAINKFADQWYGVRIDFNSADPALQRIGRDDLHRTLPIQSRMRRCVLSDTGVVQYYLDAEDSTKKADGTAANLDGTDGQVMVEIPAFYYKCEQDADGATVMISEYPLPGFHYQRLQYVSAYQATIDRERNALASVASMAERYRGCGNQQAWDGTYRTALGRPVGAVSLTNFRSYARARGAYGLNGAGWNCYTYEANRAIYWLYVIEYANFNSQAAFNAEADSNGFKQGGLGAGVSTLNSGKWSAFNNYYPFVPCGYTNSLGNATGVVDFEMPAEYDPEAASPLVVQVPSYRGIENPFGHVFHWMDGALVDVQSDEAGGRSLLYVCFDPAKYSSTSVADYEQVGDVPRVNSWIKRLIIGEHICNVAADTGAASTTYCCDFFWGQNIPTSGSQLHGLIVGGIAYYGATGGLATACTIYAPTIASANIGSRLCFVPS